jgi:hypothetical protein
LNAGSVSAIAAFANNAQMSAMTKLGREMMKK